MIRKVTEGYYRKVVSITNRYREPRLFNFAAVSSRAEITTSSCWRIDIFMLLQCYSRQWVYNKNIVIYSATKGSLCVSSKVVSALNAFSWLFTPTESTSTKLRGLLYSTIGSTNRTSKYQCQTTRMAHLSVHWCGVHC